MNKKPVARDEQNNRMRIASMYNVPEFNPEQARETISKNLTEGKIDQATHDTALKQLDSIKKGGHKYIRREGTPGNYKYIYHQGRSKSEKSIEAGDRIVTKFSGTIDVKEFREENGRPTVIATNGRKYAGWELNGAEIIHSFADNDRKRQERLVQEKAEKEAARKEREQNRFTGRKYDAAIKEWASSLKHDLGDDAMDNAGETVENFMLMYPDAETLINNRHMREGIYDVSARDRIQWDIEARL